MSESDEKLRTRVEELTLELQASEARFHNVVIGSADGIIIVDESGIIRFANPAVAALFNRTEEALPGLNFGFPVVVGETTELDIVRNGSGAVVEVRVTDTEWEGSPARLLTLRDITERKQAEQEILRLNTDLAARASELETANRELEAFNYTVAHDLRGPLNVVSGYCQVIQELCSARLDEPCREYIAETYKGTMRMNDLIDALLNFSRMGHVEPHREMVNFCELAHDVASMLRLTDPERQVDFRITDNITAYADKKLMQVVLNNLIGNAWKYTGTRTDTVIEFSMTDNGGRPVYMVRDNGAGFDKEDADKLFLPFQRLHGSEQFKGFGIGLATVERIIRRHGGRIWAEGEPGKGATFYFTLSPVKSLLDTKMRGIEP